MKASDAVVKFLEKQGVSFVFGLPGEENLDLIDSISRSNIGLIVTRHESAAGFMAATYARLTGKVGVCITTLGPGISNATTAISFSYLGGMPTLFISGQKPIHDNEQAYFQDLEVTSMIRPISKSSITVDTGKELIPILFNSLRTSLMEKQGPSHVELPEDIAQAEIEVDNFKHLNHQMTVNLAKNASLDVIESVAKRIVNSKKPLIVFGLRSNRHRVCKSAREFIKSSGIFSLSTQMGKGVVDESSELYLGNAAVSSDDYIHEIVEKSDLIINIGHDSVEKPPFLLNGKRTDIIHIDYESAKVHQVYTPKYEIIGCIKNSLNKLGSILEKENINFSESFKDEYKKIKEEIYQKDLSHLPENSPEKIVSELREIIPKDGIISLDNGLYKLWFSRNYPAYSPNTVLLDNALATMGAGLSAAIAAKLVSPEKKVLAICGDGGFMMNAQEILTAKSLNLALTIIVLVDKSYGMIKWKQKNMGLKNYAMDFENPNFSLMAKSYNINGVTVNNKRTLRQSVQESFENGGINLIEVPIDYYGEYMTLPKKLKEQYEVNKSC